MTENTYLSHNPHKLQKKYKPGATYKFHVLSTTFSMGVRREGSGKSKAQSIPQPWAPSLVSLTASSSYSYFPSAIFITDSILQYS